MLKLKLMPFGSVTMYPVEVLFTIPKELSKGHIGGTLKHSYSAGRRVRLTGKEALKFCAASIVS